MVRYYNNTKDKYLFRTIAINKNIYHNFEIYEKYEAGIVLKGMEIKSCRDNNVVITNSYVRIESMEIFLFDFYISRYQFSYFIDYTPNRPRKLLMHRYEINKLFIKLKKNNSLFIVPTKIYIKKGLIKLEIAVAKRKLKIDNREKMRKKDAILQVKNISL